MNELKIVICPLCNSDKAKTLTKKKKNYEGSAICKNCGLVYLSPGYSALWYDEYYSSKERVKEVNKIRRKMHDYAQKQKIKGQNIYNFFLSEIRNFSLEGKSVFEVGCTAGGILQLFKEKGASVVEGIDLESDYVNYGKEKFSINIQTSSIYDYDNDKKYDIVILRHVLEHLADPIKALKKIKNILSDDGILYVEVPSSFSMGITKNMHANFIYYHPVIYSPQTLINALQKSGLAKFSKNQLQRRSHMRLLARKTKNKNSSTSFKRENYMKVYLLYYLYHYTTFIRKLYYRSK